MRDLLITGARLIDPATGLDGPGDLLVRDGAIADLGTGLSAPEGATVVKPRPPKTWKVEDAPADEQGQPQGSNGKGTTGNNGNGKGKLQGW